MWHANRTYSAQDLSHATISLPAEGEQSLCQEREETGFIAVAKQVYGCRVVQRIMESCRLPGWKDRICREARAYQPLCDVLAGLASGTAAHLRMQALEGLPFSMNVSAGRRQLKPRARQTSRDSLVSRAICRAAGGAFADLLACGTRSMAGLLGAQM